MRFLALFFAVGLLLALAAGCGQKGVLYLREKPPPGMKPAKPAPVKPIPYPDQPASDTGSQADPEKQ
jgi:predicted small lipoprotein YifL